MEKYLYGARIKGIQSFIFETGKLTEIIGASELVERFCKEAFQSAFPGGKFNDDQLFLSAAGNIRYVFEDRHVCQEVLLNLPKVVYQLAPGLDLQQAVVAFEDILSNKELQGLDENFREGQTRAATPFNPAYMLTKRSPRTGGSAIAKKLPIQDEDGPLDLNQFRKRQATLLEKGEQSKQDHIFRKFLDPSDYKKRFPKEVGDLLGKKNDNNKSWIAIVHADGNGLGNFIKQLVDDFEELKKGQLPEFLKAFSNSLESATVGAFKYAYEKIVKPVFDEEANKENNNKLPIQPVLLGGDDLTIIIRGELAIEFSAKYLQQFEIQTKLAFNQLYSDYPLEKLREGLTACAGIAFIKVNFPFHFGVDLSDSLCQYAKKTAKRFLSGELSSPTAADMETSQTALPKRVPSCLMFHKVLSSFVADYGQLIRTELTAESSGKKVQFNYGPYFLEAPGNGYLTISGLRDMAKNMGYKNAPQTAISEWLEALDTDFDIAAQQLIRMRNLNKTYVPRLNLNQAIVQREEQKSKKEKSYTHLFDVLSLASINK